MTALAAHAQKAASHQSGDVRGRIPGVGTELFDRAIHGSGESAGPKPFARQFAARSRHNLSNRSCSAMRKRRFTAPPNVMWQGRRATGGTLFPHEVGEVPLGNRSSCCAPAGRHRGSGRRAQAGEGRCPLISATNRKLLDLGRPAVTARICSIAGCADVEIPPCECA